VGGMRMRVCIAVLVAIAIGAIAEGCGSGGARSANRSGGSPSSVEPLSTGVTHEVSHRVKLSPAEESAAQAMGRRACAHQTAIQVARRYVGGARRAGLTKSFASFAVHPPPSIESSSGYPRLAASVYAKTVPPRKSVAAASGCAEELAVR
jgi:hypothetical protein